MKKGEYRQIGYSFEMNKTPPPHVWLLVESKPFIGHLGLIVPVIAIAALDQLVLCV
jgi:hypothetical protein